jgi:sulfur carrier protein ThiS
MNAEHEGTITVTLQLHPLLRPYASCPSGEDTDRLSVPAGTTVGAILRGVCGLPADMQVFAAVNGRSTSLSSEVHDGDTVIVFMAVGGG